MLNMRSTDDRSTQARIRDAAIACFADGGVARTSIRTIADAASVSPGLVIHYFGSKEELREACDQHVAAIIRDLKSSAMAAGVGFDVGAALNAIAEGPPYSRYLARILVDASPRVDDLVDEIVADSVKYMETGVATGLVKPSQYPYERAAILAIWSLGALVLHEHVERLIGIDPTGDYTQDPTALAGYMGPILEIGSKGFVTEATVKMMSEAFVEPPFESPTERQEK
jgi:AcrR family transcriptional regulator